MPEPSDHPKTPTGTHAPHGPAPRRTLARPTQPIAGRGLFTSRPGTIAFHPGRHGLRFLVGHRQTPVPARCRALDDAPIHPAFERHAPRSTNLADLADLDAQHDARAATVEHALSALVALGITDCDVHLAGPEVPILDGSALSFARVIADAGTHDLPGGVRPITLDAPLTVQEGQATITATPRAQPGISITYLLDYGSNAPIKPQRATWDGSARAYLHDIAPARTFCLQHEATALQALGLFQGLTPADMLVIGPDGPIDNAYRMPNEPAAHKLLDAIGDFALAGRPIQADITCHRSGHALNHRLACALADLAEAADKSDQAHHAEQAHHVQASDRAGNAPI
ncbi:MAG: hypothetical protein KatS3mg103_1202 [Phycisphaerales bacterium]|nr:MAG: hypothetical protein KatS3mg103_1202 [Phycisphaerales bacterium]